MPAQVILPGFVDLVGWTWTDFFKSEMLTNITNDSPSVVLNGAKVGLFTGSPSLSGLTVAADLTPPVWTGYAKIDLSDPPVIEKDGQGGAYAAYPSLFFTSGSGADEIVTGIALFNSSGANLFGAGFLPSPIPVSGVQVLSFLPQITYQ